MTNSERLSHAELIEWVTYLREYPEKQGKYRLLKDGKMCCLGVLALLQGIPYKQGGSDGAAEFRFPGEPLSYESTLTSDVVLHGNLASKLGSSDGNFISMGIPLLFHAGFSHSALSSANDYGVPFSVIADHLEAHYPYQGKEQATPSV